MYDVRYLYIKMNGGRRPNHGRGYPAIHLQSRKANVYVLCRLWNLQLANFTPRPRTMEVFPDELLASVLELASALDARRCACVCRRRRHAVTRLDVSLLLVVASGSNDLVLLDGRGRLLQRIPALPPRRAGARLPRATNAMYNWPTCLAQGPSGELYLSQYRMPGLLQFDRTPAGYSYTRQAVVNKRFAAPEGVVCAHGSLYLVSVQRGTVSRFAPSGTQPTPPHPTPPHPTPPHPTPPPPSGGTLIEESEAMVTEGYFIPPPPISPICRTPLSPISQNVILFFQTAASTCSGA